MYGGDVEVYVRSNPLDPDGDQPDATDDSEQTESHDHGFRPDGQCHAVRVMHDAQQSDGGLGDGCRYGGPDTHAVHSGSGGPLGSGRQAIDHQHAGSAR